MGVAKGIGRQLTRQIGPRLAHQVAPKVAPRLSELTPGLSASFVREALHRAIAGVGPLTPAAQVAEKIRHDHDGHAARSVHGVIDHHTRLAGAQGFLTNIGGLVTMTVTLPANLTGLAVLQCRMVAAVAHLRGYDLADPRTHNAILVTILGADTVAELVEKQTIPAPPMALATAPVHDARIDAAISTAVATDLVTRVAGRRMATTVGRRVPVVGGLVGLGADGYATWKIGNYADREFLPRAAR